MGLKACLGVESTAHTFGVSIVTLDGKILSDEKAVYKPPMGRGIHPRESAQHHTKTAPTILQKAIEKAKIKPKNIVAVAFSQGPGLGPCLRTGATVARALASYLKVPLIPVHHAIGHIELAILTTGAKDPLVVLVSGGHTCIVAFAGGRWRVFGETEDITLGNLIDTYGREAGYPTPSGSAVEADAKKGKKFIDLPLTIKGNNVSYSGLLTAALNKLKGGKWRREDLSYSLQEAAFTALAETAERVLAFTEKDELLLAGGVAANRRLQEMLKAIAEEHKARFFVVPREYSGDCGAQIAWTGVLAYKHKVKVSIEKSFVKPKWRLDMVPIPWRKT
ncbi:MAG: O-sialoglycoprotein endopeptidase [Candidatus Hecatellales archaeon]|nr:MAG: O-sialoglycoprotein endopeptidase [Candidatus Hecatellales archaeon]